jgi:hypothetical protein
MPDIICLTSILNFHSDSKSTCLMTQKYDHKSVSAFCLWHQLGRVKLFFYRRFLFTSISALAQGFTRNASFGLFFFFRLHDYHKNVERY